MEKGAQDRNVYVLSSSSHPLPLFLTHPSFFHLRLLANSTSRPGDPVHPLGRSDQRGERGVPTTGRPRLHAHQARCCAGGVVDERGEQARVRPEQVVAHQADEPTDRAVETGLGRCSRAGGGRLDGGEGGLVRGGKAVGC